MSLGGMKSQIVEKVGFENAQKMNRTIIILQIPE